MRSRKTERAWAAGFFDGEGCTTAHCGYGGERLQPRVRITQNGEQGRRLLHRFRRAVGVGKVYGPYPPAKNQNLVRNYWGATSLKDVKITLRALWPHLSVVKREQAKRCFAAYKKAKVNYSIQES